MIDVFISYKVADRKTAIEYYKALKEKRLNVWFDQLIPKHDKWDKHLKDKMVDSKIVLCLISQNTIKDKWISSQIAFARKYNKRIIFINLDNTKPELFKSLKIKEAIYSSLEEANIEEHFREYSVYNDYLYLSDIAYKKNNKPFLMAGIISILAIITFFYGINIFNIHINNQISYTFIGILLMFVLSFIPSKKVYLLNGVISVGLLTFAMYAIEPFYITDISVVPLIYMLVFFFTFLVRYSNLKNYFLNFITSLLYAGVLVAFTGRVNIFFIYIFNLDVSLFNYFMLIEFLISTFVSANPHFVINDELKSVNDIISGKNIVKEVEKDYEN